MKGIINGGGAGKSFLVHLITEYMQRILRYPPQSSNQPSILVTTSTGKAAVHINGITLHSAFKLPINRDVNPKDVTLHELRLRYRFLKVLLIDQIPMIGADTFSHLVIMNSESIFGEISVLLNGDLLQLPPVKQRCIFQHGNENTYEAFVPSIWRNVFKLHDLSEVVGQSSDPEFAKLLSRNRRRTY